MLLHAHYLLSLLLDVKKIEHLASQVGKRQTRIMRVPEMMCPKKGTNMIGFLPESEGNYKYNPILSFSNLNDLPERGPR